MKRYLTFLLIAATVLNISAQESIDKPVPQKKPEITSSGTAVFNLKAPEAQAVTLRGNLSGMETSVEKSEDGIWTITVAGLAPDLYDYWFEVDGVKTLDPANPYVARDIASLSNIFVMPGSGADYYLSSDVPHGKVEKVWYESEVLGGERRMTVYTPAAYALEPERKFPVLYLLHGMGGDEEAWSELGRAVQILDNMIAAGEAEPMIVVMPNGNAMRMAAPGFTSDGMYIAEGSHSVDPEKKFEKSFPEIRTFIEENYRTIPEKNSRAVAGLSMGGGHAWRISMDCPGDYGYVGLFSPAVRWNGAGVDSSNPDKELIEKLQKQFAEAPALYLIAIGKDDFLYGLNSEYRSLLDSIGVDYNYLESEGGHTWTNWRKYLVDFLPKAFK